ncbi:MAG: alpha/beta hydrolase [Actinobacteria bacterium]|nr:alpha/beta hydrolase [Actinomycetota bacterium]
MARTSPSRAVVGYLRKYPLAPRYGAGRSLTLWAADGVRLAATLLDGPASAPASVVIAPGFSNWSRTPGIHAFATLLARSVNVVVLDMRGHGRSGGTCTFAISEPLDVQAAVTAARKEWPGQPVVTVGVSLGAAAVLLHAGSTGGVAGVVAVSGPAWYGFDGGEGSARVQRWMSRRSTRLFLASVMRTRVKATCEAVPDSSALMGCISPAFTVIVHDPGDWYFGPEHADNLFEWASEPKALWWYPGGGHGTDLLTPAFAARVLAETSYRLGIESG